MHSRDYQVILVDNDLPDQITDRIVEMPMTHEQPFVPGVTNAHVDDDPVEAEPSMDNVD